ncbi:MAG: response regulator transcription factor [Chloroflexota bacterium]|nr:response regulator transcription factor [Chloroflexota bacterium]
MHTLHLCIAEEQALYREVWDAFFRAHPLFTCRGMQADTSPPALMALVHSHTPHVLVVGMKHLTAERVQSLQEVRVSCPQTALTVLASLYDTEAVAALRTLARSPAGGCAVLLKSTLNTTDDLAAVLRAVAEGRILLDPSLFEQMLTRDTSSPLMQSLSPRELEVLGLMARGYTNTAIAQTLYLDTKTVERHINNIYNKVGVPVENAHPRVYVVMQYLRAKGLLPRHADPDLLDASSRPKAPNTPVQSHLPPSFHPHRKRRIAHHPLPSPAGVR